MRVSAIVNCCSEGLLLRPTLHSVMRSIRDSGFQDACEIIVVADNATRLTMSVIDKFSEYVTRVIATDFADLGSARNAGVEAACGELVLFIDGDDLWSRNWVAACWNESRRLPSAAVMHPHYCVCFGASNELFAHPDYRDPSFDIRGIVLDNYWSALSALPRSLARDNPYPTANSRLGFGYEDWSWNATTFAMGIRHVVVPRTCHFVHLKRIESMQSSMRGYLPIPSAAFADFLAWDIQTRPYDL